MAEAEAAATEASSRRKRPRDEAKEEKEEWMKAHEEAISTSPASCAWCLLRSNDKPGDLHSEDNGGWTQFIDLNVGAFVKKKKDDSPPGDLEFPCLNTLPPFAEYAIQSFFFSSLLCSFFIFFCACHM